MDRAFAAAGLALRARRNWIQLAKFCAVGVVGYAVNLSVYSLLLNWANLYYLVAAVGSFAVAVTNNYLLNRYWTFHHQRGHFEAEECRLAHLPVVRHRRVPAERPTLRRERQEVRRVEGGDKWPFGACWRCR